MSNKVGANTPLSLLIKQTLRKFGDGSGSYRYAGDSEAFILYANDVIREINWHPYSDESEDIEYFRHEQEARPIDDLVLIKGMLFFYAQDQASKRAPMFRADYYQTLAAWLYKERYGTGPIQLQVVDYENQS